MSIHSPWCLRARAVFWGIFPIPAPPFVNAGRAADTAEHEQMMGEGKSGRRAGENNMRRWLAKDEEMSQGSNKFRDKRRTDRVNGQSKATDEVESECEGQQRRVRQRKRRVGWWWKEKKEHTEAPHRMTLYSTYIMFSVIIPVCFLLCIILHLNSNQVEARTLEMAPEGAVLLELNHVSSRALRARWTAPSRPNGNLIYTLHYKSKGSSGHLFS